MKMTARILLVFLALSALPSWAQRLVSFNQAPVIKLPSSSLHSAAGDLNHDGRPDLILSAGYGSLLVLMNTGGGTFAGPRTLHAGGTSPGIAMADFNGDGNLDIATQAAGGIATFLGDGTGEFSDPIPCPCNFRLETAADFNGDGAPDLATASTDGVVILFNDGEGRFTAPRSIPLAAGVQTLTVADLDGDGNLDVAATHYNDTFSLVFGNGDATFQPAVVMNAGATSSRVVVDDFDEDGLPDLAIFQEAELSLWLGQGNREFSPAKQVPIVFSPYPTTAQTGDFNLDGHRDLAWITGVDVGINLLFGDGAGHFEPVHYAAGRVAITFAVADFDGDGTPDIAAPGAIGETLSMLLNKGEGKFAGTEMFPPGTLPALTMVLADFNPRWPSWT